MEHGIESAHWNNIGGGWQILCLCGWGSACDNRMEAVGEEFDEHLMRGRDDRAVNFRRNGVPLADG